MPGDAEVIAEWMEPKPIGVQADPPTWWMFESVATGWAPRLAKLDALWHVEERLIRLGYADACNLAIVSALHGEDTYSWHATIEQKLRALADLIRNASPQSSVGESDAR